MRELNLKTLIFKHYMIDVNAKRKKEINSRKVIYYFIHNKNEQAFLKFNTTTKGIHSKYKYN